LKQFTFGKEYHEDKALKTIKQKTIKAKNLETAIKIFKIEVLFPESYVSFKHFEYENGYPQKKYDSQLGRYIPIFNTKNPTIPIFENDILIKEIPLNENINIDYREMLHQKVYLPSPQSNDEKSLEVVGNTTAIKNFSKIEIRQKHDEILKKQAVLELKKRELDAAMKALKDELNQKTKLIYIIETYLGIHEEIYQLNSGEKASEDEPLHLYQEVLYMDEEIGIWCNDGLDYTQIEKFDEWISENFDKFLYKEKSICVFQVRRRNKDYGDPFLNMMTSSENLKTYFLIRNGENLYRIWSNILIKDYLFPLSNTYDEIYAEESRFIDNEERIQEKIKQEMQKYMYGMFAIQGLIERTDIFGNDLKKFVDLTKPLSLPEDKIKLIRDAEKDYWLSDGKLSWFDFIKINQKKVNQGTRVILTIKSCMRYEHRELEYRTGFKTITAWPDHYSLYTIEEKIENSKFFGFNWKIKYLPQEIWTERKNKVSFSLYEDEVINFDHITLEDCEYYQKNRFERKNYLEILPILDRIRKLKIEEKNIETEFIKFVAGKLKLSEKDYSKIQEVINWWKLKNKWKRALTKDETKAVRMIISKLKSVLS